MYEIGPEHPLTYRQELLQPLFDRIRAADSAAVVGAASMGKSRLLQFMLRPDVQGHYLGEQNGRTLLLWIDCNRLLEASPWALYELMLTALVEAASDERLPEHLRQMLNDLRREVILSENTLLAQRHLELAVHMLCHEHDLVLCLILDEFDLPLAALTPPALAGLRALRDANKYRLQYILFMRNPPDLIREPDDYEGFYELFSRSVFGLQPYGQEDARRILAQLGERHEHELPPLSEENMDELLRLSGGHPGLMVGLIDTLVAEPPLGQEWASWAAAAVRVQEELRKLWAGLRLEERQLLNHTAQGMETDFRLRQSLLTKGLLRENGEKKIGFFTPLLAAYAAEAPVEDGAVIYLDEVSGDVYVRGVQVPTLTQLEFKLLHYLYQEQGSLRSQEEIGAHIYRMDPAGSDKGTIPGLVRRIRRKIEPDPGHPIYLVNIPGRGYRLAIEPD